MAKKAPVVDSKSSKIVAAPQKVRVQYNQSLTLSCAIKKSAAAIKVLPQYQFSGIRSLEEMLSRKRVNA